MLCINKSARRLFFIRDGRLVDDYSIRVGREGMRTREGVFDVYSKERNSWSNLYHVWMPFAMYFDGGQAVHYSVDFAANGYAEGSHGCVNVRDRAGAEKMFESTPVGSKVVVFS